MQACNLSISFDVDNHRKCFAALYELGTSKANLVPPKQLVVIILSTSFASPNPC